MNEQQQGDQAQENGPTGPAEYYPAGAGQHIKALSDAFIAGQKKSAAAPVPGTKDQLICVPDDHNLIEVDERLGDKPRHLKRTITLFKPADAISYTNRFKNEYSLIELAPEPADNGVAAVITIDSHQPGEGGQRFGNHVVKLKVRTSWQFKLLKRLSSGKIPQANFALALRDLARYCVTMPAADVLELVRSLSLTSTGKFHNHEDELTGGVDFIYNLQVKASAGTQQRTIHVPQQIAWEIPVLLGGEPKTIITDFLYAVPDDPSQKVSMGFRLNDEAELLDSLVRDLGEELTKGTGLLAVTSEF